MKLESISSARKRGRQRRAIALTGLWLATAGLLPAPVAAAGSSSVATEEKVEAAYLYKCLNYADWPPAAFPRADTPYVIGVAGDDAVADELAHIAAGRSVNNRGVIVKRVLPADALNDLHMLFIGPAERTRQLQWLRQAKGRPIVTVTAFDGALEQGAIINF